MLKRSLMMVAALSTVAGAQTTVTSDDGTYQLLGCAVQNKQVVCDVTYTLTITNQGTDDEAQVTLLQQLSGLTELVSVSSAQGVCRSDDLLAVGCDLGALAASASTTVTVVVRPLSEGIVVTSANVQGFLADVAGSDNTDSESFTAFMLP